MNIQAKTFRARAEHEKKLLGLANVVGVMVGKKIRDGVQTDEDAVMVLVQIKLGLDELAAQDVVPADLRGVATDVLEVGDLKALGTPDPTGKFRPAPAGVSIGHYRITAGTFGAVVRDVATDELLILSNNHVLSDSNDAKVGDPILQPGPADGGTLNDELGRLKNFVPIVFETEDGCSFVQKFVCMANRVLGFLGRCSRLAVANDVQIVNMVDCAVAKPHEDGDILPEILEIGKPLAELGPIIVGQLVQKFGRTTGYTEGNILGADATVEISYGAKGKARFEHQIVTGPMSAGGDSGSLVMDAERRPVGLLFAGSESVTILNEIARVVEALGITFAV